MATQTLALKSNQTPLIQMQSSANNPIPIKSMDNTVSIPVGVTIPSKDRFNLSSNQTRSSGNQSNLDKSVSKQRPEHDYSVKEVPEIRPKQLEISSPNSKDPNNSKVGPVRTQLENDSTNSKSFLTSHSGPQLCMSPRCPPDGAAFYEVSPPHSNSSTSPVTHSFNHPSDPNPSQMTLQNEKPVNFRPDKQTRIDNSGPYISSMHNMKPDYSKTTHVNTTSNTSNIINESSAVANTTATITNNNTIITNTTTTNTTACTSNTTTTTTTVTATTLTTTATTTSLSAIAAPPPTTNSTTSITTSGGTSSSSNNNNNDNHPYTNPKMRISKTEKHPTSSSASTNFGQTLSTDSAVIKNPTSQNKKVEMSNTQPSKSGLNSNSSTCWFPPPPPPPLQETFKPPSDLPLAPHYHEHCKPDEVNLIFPCPPNSLNDKNSNVLNTISNSNISTYPDSTELCRISGSPTPPPLPPPPSPPSRPLVPPRDPATVLQQNRKLEPSEKLKPTAQEFNAPPTVHNLHRQPSDPICFQPNVQPPIPARVKPVKSEALSIPKTDTIPVDVSKNGPVSSGITPITEHQPITPNLQSPVKQTLANTVPDGRSVVPWNSGIREFDSDMSKISEQIEVADDSVTPTPGQTASSNKSNDSANRYHHSNQVQIDPTLSPHHSLSPSKEKPLVFNQLENIDQSKVVKTHTKHQLPVVTRPQFLSDFNSIRGHDHLLSESDVKHNNNHNHHYHHQQQQQQQIKRYFSDPAHQIHDRHSRRHHTTSDLEAFYLASDQHQSNMDVLHPGLVQNPPHPIHHQSHSIQDKPISYKLRPNEDNFHHSTANSLEFSPNYSAEMEWWRAQQRAEILAHVIKCRTASRYLLYLPHAMNDDIIKLCKIRSPDQLRNVAMNRQNTEKQRDGLRRSSGESSQRQLSGESFFINTTHGLVQLSPTSGGYILSHNTQHSHKSGVSSNKSMKNSESTLMSQSSMPARFPDHQMEHFPQYFRQLQQVSQNRQRVVTSSGMRTSFVADPREPQRRRRVSHKTSPSCITEPVTPSYGCAMTQSVFLPSFESGWAPPDYKSPSSGSGRRRRPKNGVMRSQSHRDVDHLDESHSHSHHLISSDAYHRSISHTIPQESSESDAWPPVMVQWRHRKPNAACSEFFASPPDYCFDGHPDSHVSTDMCHSQPHHHSTSAITERLEYQPWFHFDLSRSNAEKLLKSAPTGSFLVRQSETSKSQLSLSIKRVSDVLHMKISQDPESGHYVLGEYSQPYPSVGAMIYRYSRSLLPVRGTTPVLLRFPVHRPLSQKTIIS